MNFLIKTRLISATLAASLLIGCGTFSSQNSTGSLALTPLAWQASAAAYADPHGIIRASDEGIALVTDSGEQLLWPHASEHLDALQHNGQYTVVGLDHKRQIVLFELGTLSSVMSTTPLDFAPEGLCLFADGPDLQLFVLGEDLLARQFLLLKSSDTLTALKLRELPLPPAAEYCTTDARSTTLFVSEPAIGVWAYPARAESEVTRKVVDLVQPYGNISQHAGPLAVAAGFLWVVDPHARQLKQYGLQTVAGHFASKNSYLLSGSREPESFALLSSASGRTNVLLVEDDADVLTTQMLITPQTLAPADMARVMPLVETEAVPDLGDAADDPAIWFNVNEPSASLVIGTNKKRGLEVYDLQGKRVQSLPLGRLNNVDVRQGFRLAGKLVDLAAASHRDHAAIALFAIEPTTGKLQPAGEIKTGLDDVYGFCLYRGRNNALYAFINDEDGRYEQYQITDSPAGWQGALVREFSVPSQPEGCSADESNHTLFVGEEAKGIWLFGAEPDDTRPPTLIAKVGEQLVADVEGMEVFQHKGEQLLLVSSQGNDSYLVLEATEPFAIRSQFRIDLNASLMLDGASETDGLTVSTKNFGGPFARGLVVVQDGRNLLPQTTQNFKLVSLADILALGQ